MTKTLPPATTDRFTVTFGPQAQQKDTGFDPNSGGLTVFARDDGDLYIEEWQRQGPPTNGVREPLVVGIRYVVDRTELVRQLCGDTAVSFDTLQCVMIERALTDYAGLLDIIGSCSKESTSTDD